MNERHDRVIDELLVMRCQAGSREAFDQLVRRWQRRLWRYARTITGNEDTAWDVTQETWMAVLRQMRKLNDPAWFAVWVYRIVRNKCADHRRGAERRRRLVVALAEWQRVENNPRRDASADALLNAMQRLPADQRELLSLKYGGDLNVAEIAVILNIPVGTVKSRLHHARNELRDILEGGEL